MQALPRVIIWIVLYIWSQRSWGTDVSLFSKRCQGRLSQPAARVRDHVGLRSFPDSDGWTPGFGAGAAGPGVRTEPWGWMGRGAERTCPRILFHFLDVFANQQSFLWHRRASCESVWMDVLGKESVTTPPNQRNARSANGAERRNRRQAERSPGTADRARGSAAAY